MTQTIPARNIELYSLQDKFGLERCHDPKFFPEWQQAIAPINEADQETLNAIKTEFNYLSNRPILEAMVKMVVVSPLLRLAGFYRSPFFMAAEKEIRITSKDEDLEISGRLNLLVFSPEFWLLCIETKSVQYSIEVGIPQILTYMLGMMEHQQQGYGMVTNGTDFIFVKCDRGTDTTPPRYALSDGYSLRKQKNELIDVLQILRALAQQAIANTITNQTSNNSDAEHQ